MEVILETTSVTSITIIYSYFPYFKTQILLWYNTLSRLFNQIVQEYLRDLELCSVLKT